VIKITLGEIGEEYMRDDRTLAEAGQQYAAAYAAHYTTKDLYEALGLYQGVMVAHPDTREAEYSRSQLQNIATSVVPKQDLLDAQVELAFAHLEREGPQEVEPAPTALLASELTMQRKPADPLEEAIG
jgi:hypothetical protein